MNLLMRALSQEALKRFWEDKEMLGEVRDYFFAHLDTLGLERIYKRGDTIGIADAKDALWNAFIQLDDLFEKSNDKKKEPINEAR